MFVISLIWKRSRVAETRISFRLSVLILALPNSLFNLIRKGSKEYRGPRKNPIFCGRKTAAMESRKILLIRCAVTPCASAAAITPPTEVPTIRSNCELMGAPSCCSYRHNNSDCRIPLAPPPLSDRIRKNSVGTGRPLPLARKVPLNIRSGNLQLHSKTHIDIFSLRRRSNPCLYLTNYPTILHVFKTHLSTTPEGRSHLAR